MSVLKHLDLASVFKKEKPVAKPEIIGVITMKSEGYDSVKGQIQEAGFSVEKAAEMEDGSVLFGQAEDMTGEHVLIRLSENAVMAVKSFSPYNMSMSMTDGTSFAEVCKAQGFYPGVGTMVDVLRSGVLQLAEKSDDPQAASVQVGKMFDEAKQYAMTMVSGLPSKAFKLESVYPEEPVVAEKSDEEKAAEAAAAQKALDDAAAAEAVVKAAAKPMDGDGADGEGKDDIDPATGKPKVKPVVQKSEGEAAASLTAEDVTGLVAKQMTEFATKMETLFGGVSKAVEGVGSSVEALAGRVEAAEAVAKAAKEAVSGTVVLGSDGGDSEVVVKQEARTFGREIDTAYMPRAQRNAGRR